MYRLLKSVLAAAVGLALVAGAKVGMAEEKTELEGTWVIRAAKMAGRSAEALALYLFLVTVADGQGLSYYSDAGIGKLLPLDESALARARQELIRARLIAYEKPLYQVLSLDPPVPRSGHAESLGQILRQMRLPT